MDDSNEEKIPVQQLPTQPSETPEEPPVTPDPVELPLEARSDVDPLAQPVAPVFNPAPSAPAPFTVQTENKNSPGILILQWLTYAFWGWCILALSWLTSLSIGYLVDGSDSSGIFGGEMIAYSLAAVLVLFVISLACDIIYTRFEPLKKHGAATVIMVIHAVIFALFAIGWLITGVFAIVRMLIGSSSFEGGDGPLVLLLTSIIIAIVYGLALLRTFRPAKITKLPVIYWSAMSLIVAVITLIGIFGPVAQASLTRDDRLIEDALPTLSEDIQQYAQEENRLPATLDELKDSSSDSVQQLLERNLVEYKANTKPASTPSEIKRGFSMNEPGSSSKVYYYELCVTYKAEKRDKYGYSDYRSKTYVSTYSHDAGRVCYDLQTDEIY